jgi:hypothetical protein
MMLPFLMRREQVLSTLGSLGNLLPTIVALLTLISRNRAAFNALAACLGCFYAIYAWCEAHYLKRRTPWQRWPLLVYVALVTPLETLRALLGDNLIEWRDVRMRVQRGGRFELDG